MTDEHGTLSSDIRPSTLSVIWKAERTDLPLTAEAALTRARTVLTGQGAQVTEFDRSTLTFVSAGNKRHDWMRGLLGCRVRAEREGARVTVTVEGSFTMLIVGIAGAAVLPLMIRAPLWFGYVAAGIAVAQAWWAASRLKYVAQYATCMVPDEVTSDSESIV